MSYWSRSQPTPRFGWLRLAPGELLPLQFNLGDFAVCEVVGAVHDDLRLCLEFGSSHDHAGEQVPRKSQCRGH